MAYVLQKGSLDTVKFHPAANSRSGGRFSHKGKGNHVVFTTSGNEADVNVLSTDGSALWGRHLEDSELKAVPGLVDFLTNSAQDPNVQIRNPEFKVDYNSQFNFPQDVKELDAVAAIGKLLGIDFQPIVSQANQPFSLSDQGLQAYIFGQGYNDGATSGVHDIHYNQPHLADGLLIVLRTDGTYAGILLAFNEQVEHA